MLNAIYPIGRRIYTWRHAAVDTGGVAITIPSDLPDIMRVIIHIEGTTSIATFTGQTHTGSAAFILTSDGKTMELPVAASKGSVICTVKAPASTINVSVMAISRLGQ